MKQKFTKDGGAFQMAVSKSGKNVDDIQKSMEISNGTFYRLYRKEIFSKEEKQTAAKALDKSVEEIFGAVTTNSSDKKQYFSPHDDDNNSLTLSSQQKENDMVVNKALDMLDKQLAKKDEQIDRFLSILEADRGIVDKSKKEKAK